MSKSNGMKRVSLKKAREADSFVAVWIERAMSPDEMGEGIMCGTYFVDSDGWLWEFGEDDKWWNTKNIKFFEGRDDVTYFVKDGEG